MENGKTVPLLSRIVIFVKIISMKIVIRIFVLSSLVIATSCGKKKCNTCPDWGKADTKVENIEEA